MTEVRKFGATGYEYRVHWREVEKAPDVQKTVKEALGEAISGAFRDGGHPQDRVGVEVNHPALERPINIGFTTQEKLTSDKIVRTIEKVQQSATGLDFDSSLNVKFTRVKLPRGGRPGQQ